MRTDDILLTAWRDGDRHAGDELVQRYFSQVYRFFGTRLSDGVDDLIQRTFLDLVAARDRVGEGGFRAYLFRVARNRLIDHLRHKLGQPDFDPLHSVVPASVGQDPNFYVMRQEEVRLLRRALLRLPLDHQIALGLYYWDGLTASEIGVVLEVPGNTVRSRLTRARDALREHIAVLAASPALCTSTVEGLDSWAAKVGELARVRSPP